MKKTILIIVSLSFLLLCGCVNYPLYDHYGVWESEDSKMRIVMGANGADVFGDDGILINEDGSVIPIVYRDLHGQFFVFENKGDGSRGDISAILFSGTFKVKKQTLILNTKDGKEIILRKVSNEIPETESLSEQ